MSLRLGQVHWRLFFDNGFWNCFCFMFIFNSMISWALSIHQRFFSIDSSICETAFVFCSSSSSKISWTLSSSLNFILWRWFLKLLLLCLPVHFHLQWSLGPYQIHWSFSFIIHLLKLILASCSSSPSMFSWTFPNSLRVFFIHFSIAGINFGLTFIFKGLLESFRFNELFIHINFWNQLCVQASMLSFTFYFVVGFLAWNWLQMFSHVCYNETF